MSKFSKIAKRWVPCAPSAPLTADFGDLKLRDLLKLWLFKLIMTKSNFQKYQLWRHFSDITVITSPN